MGAASGRVHSGPVPSRRKGRPRRWPHGGGFCSGSGRFPFRQPGRKKKPLKGAMVSYATAPMPRAFSRCRKTACVRRGGSPGRLAWALAAQGELPQRGVGKPPRGGDAPDPSLNPSERRRRPFAHQRKPLDTKGFFAVVRRRGGAYSMANSFTLLVPLSSENRWARSCGVNDMLEVSRVSRDRKSTRLNSSHSGESRMPSSA